MEDDEIIASIILISSASSLPNLKRALILNSPTALIERIVSIVRAVLFGDIEIDERAKRHLSRFRLRIHRIAAKEKSDIIKRRYLAQKSSLKILSSLLTAALPSLQSSGQHEWKEKRLESEKE